MDAEENGVLEEEDGPVIENPRRTTLNKARESVHWPYSTFFASVSCPLLCMPLPLSWVSTHAFPVSAM
jgi:hypothetical protein